MGWEQMEQMTADDLAALTGQASPDFELKGGIGAGLRAAAEKYRMPMTDRETLIAYLLMKARQEDWHACADAAMDLREMDAEERARRGR